MRINPIGLGYGNLKPNKVEKNNSKVMSNPVESSQKLAKLSLEQLQGINNISFKSNSSNQDEIEAILNSPLLKTDRDGRTFFHRASAEDIEARRQEITPQLLRIAMPMQDYDSNTCLHYTKGSEFVNTIADILGDEAPEFIPKLYTLKNKMNRTPIDIKACRKKQDELEALFKILGNRTTKFVREYRSANGSTIFHYPLKPEVAQIIIDNMGDEAQQVLSELLPMQDDDKNTLLHNIQRPKTLEIYAETLKDKAPEVFAKACLAKNKKGEVAMSALLANNYQGKLKIILKALGNKTAEVVKKYRGEYNETIFHHKLEPDIAQIIVDNMGDEAQQVLSELLPMQDNDKFNKSTFLCYEQHPETLEIYAKALKDNASEVFAKACINGDTFWTIYRKIGEFCREKELNTIFKILGNKTAEIVRDCRTIFHQRLTPELAQIIIDNLGDEAQQVLYELLPMAEGWRYTFLHTRQNPATLNIYRKALKNETT